MAFLYKSELVDRFQMASYLCKGRRVLDIGGQHPMNHVKGNPFGDAYRRIIDSASQYEIFDRDQKQGVKFVGDLNTVEGQKILLTALKVYKPDAILCMEILEHLNYPCAVMDALAEYIETNRSAVIFLTLPNNGNWILNALNWHQDHTIAFFKSIAARFVQRSRLGRYMIIMRPCMQKYRWFWFILLILSFGQPFNWSFEIRSEASA